MIKNTFYLIVLAGLWMAHSTWAAPLEAGHYMLYSPVLYNYRDGEVWNAISYLRRENERTAKLRVLMKEDVTLTINSTGDDRVAVEGWARMGAARVLVEGEGKLISRNTVKGSLTKKYGHLPFEVAIKKGQWYLRPAMEREIAEARLSILTEASRNMVPSYLSAEELKAIKSVDTEGKRQLVNFLENTSPLFKKGELEAMLSSGEIVYDPGAHAFSYGTSGGPALSGSADPPPISSDVDVEHHPLTVEELMEMGAIDEDTPKEGVEKLRKQLKQGQSDLEQERREREAPISPEVDTYRISIPLVIGLIILILIAGIVTWIIIRRRRR